MTPCSSRANAWQLLCAMGIAAVTLGCSSTEPEVDTGNLVANGGFEAGPELWTASVLSGRLQEFCTLAVDSTEAHSGQRSAMIRIHPDHPSTVYFYNWFQPLVAGFEVGGSYVLEAWGRTSGVAQEEQVYVDVRFFNANNRQVGREWTRVPGSPPSLGGRPEWQRLTIPFVVPEGTVVIDIRAGITAPINAGATVWFDDISVIPVGGP
jgi:hypothetical protein